MSFVWWCLPRPHFRDHFETENFSKRSDLVCSDHSCPSARSLFECSISLGSAVVDKAYVRARGFEFSLGLILWAFVSEVFRDCCFGFDRRSLRSKRLWLRSFDFLCADILVCWHQKWASAHFGYPTNPLNFANQQTRSLDTSRLFSHHLMRIDFGDLDQNWDWKWLCSVYLCWLTSWNVLPYDPTCKRKPMTSTGQSQTNYFWCF